MKKIFTIIALACFACTTMNAQLLYKISGNGLSKPSYIIGTHHLSDGNFAQKVPGVIEALANTEQVYGELDMSFMQNPDSLAEVQKAMMLPDGKNIKDVLTEEQLGKLNKFMTSIVGADFTNPMLMQQLGHMSPKTLQSQLAVLVYLTKHPGTFDPNNQFDTYFQNEAIKANKVVKGLETIKYQTDILYKSSDEKRDVELLMCLCDNIDWNIMMLDNITKAFYNQDLVEMGKIWDEKLNTSCDSTPEEEAQLIYNRNNNWLKIMPAVMAEHPTFFAVGAGHLINDKGVLALLRNAGYTVEGVK